jgi:hypothetical protein
MTAKEYDGTGLYFRGEPVPPDPSKMLTPADRLPMPREDRVFMGPLLFAKWREFGWIDEQGRLTIPEPETSE